MRAQRILNALPRCAGRAIDACLDGHPPPHAPTAFVLEPIGRHERGQQYRIVGNPPCPVCEAPLLACYPGKWPACWRCGHHIVTYGRTPGADCVTPSGLVGCHGERVRMPKGGGPDVCAFCGRPA